MLGFRSFQLGMATVGHGWLSVGHNWLRAIDRSTVLADRFSDRLTDCLTVFFNEFN